MSDDDVGRQLDQFFCKSSDAVDVTASPAVIDPEIAALAPTEFVETLPKRRNAPKCVRVVLGGRHQHANPPHSVALLRLRSKWPRCRAAEKRDELAPLHVQPQAQGTASYQLKRILF